MPHVDNEYDVAVSHQNVTKIYYSEDEPNLQKPRAFNANEIKKRYDDVILIKSANHHSTYFVDRLITRSNLWFMKL